MAGARLDIPPERPDVNGRAVLFVPSMKSKQDVLLTVRTGSAIVGFGNPDGTFTVYFESNRFNELALSTWEHKAYKAYERLTENMPTASKMTIDGGNFEAVGYIDGKGINIRRMEILQRWLRLSGARDTGPQSELIPRVR